MTVLVLDNPELLARAALVANGQVAVGTESAQPHQLKFHYGYNQHQLSGADQALLQRHGDYLRRHPHINLRVHGHSDAFGSDDYGHFLSRLRAAAVVRQLVQQGIAEQRLQAVGWGATRPLATPADYAANRRVELQYLQS